MRFRAILSSLFIGAILAISALHAGDTTVASLVGSREITGIEFCGAGQLKFSANGSKLTLTVTQNQVTIYYADGTAMMTLKLNDSVELSGDLLSKGIGGKIDGRGFTLVPGLRFTVKNLGATVITVFDSNANKSITVQGGAVVIVEVQIDKFTNSDDVARSLRNGHLVLVGKDGKSAVLARVETGVIVMAIETMTLGKGNAQVIISPDSSIIVEIGRLSLRDGNLELSGSTLTIVTLSGSVVVTSGTTKIDLIVGMTSTTGTNGFGKPTQSTRMPAGFLFIVGGTTTNTDTTTVSGSKRGFVVLIVPVYNPTGIPGQFGQIIIIGASRFDISGTH